MTIPNWGVGELLVIVLGVIAILVIVILGIKWLKIKVLPGGAKVGEDGKVRPIHADCPHVKDIMNLIAKTVEHVEIRILAKYELIEEQMKHFEAVWLDCSKKMTETFVSALGDAMGKKEGLIDQQDYKTYMLVLGRLRTIIGDHIRVAMRLNGLAEKVGLDWSNYIKLKKQGYQQIITSELNAMYFGKDLSREALYKANIAAGLGKLLEDSVDLIFEYSREMAIRMESTLAAHKESYELFLENSITGEPLE